MYRNITSDFISVISTPMVLNLRYAGITVVLGINFESKTNHCGMEETGQDKPLKNNAIGDRKTINISADSRC